MTDLLDELYKLPIRARVAIALSAAEFSLDAIANREYLCKPARKAISDAWEWEEGGEISARQLYDHIYPLLLLLQENDDLPERCLASLQSTAYAMYYATWHARKLEIATNDRKYDRPFPNDIRDVTERTLIESIDSAKRAKPDINDQNRWGDKVLMWINQFGKTGFDDAGPCVPRLQFATTEQ